MSILAHIEGVSARNGVTFKAGKPLRCTG